MGGTVLELASDKILAQGISQGKTEGLNDAIKKLADYYQAENPTLSKQECLEMASKILR